MKKFFLFLIFIATFSCTPKSIIYGNEKGNTMLRMMNGKYSIEQFDSMCIADTIPNSLSLWEQVPLLEYETKNKVVLHLYMKESGKTESVYKVEKISDDSVKILKRIIVE